MLALRNVLIATDFSECSDRAVDEGFAIAARFDSRVHLMHVVPEPLDEIWAGFIPSADFLNVLAEHTADARKRLAALPARFDMDVPVTVHTAYGSPAAEILKYAESEDIDLLVCGTHGRRGIERLVMGSVAERLVQRASCPVLTIPKISSEAAA